MFFLDTERARWPAFELFSKGYGFRVKTLKFLQGHLGVLENAQCYPWPLRLFDETSPARSSNARGC